MENPFAHFSEAPRQGRESQGTEGNGSPASGSGSRGSFSFKDTLFLMEKNIGQFLGRSGQ